MGITRRDFAKRSAAYAAGFTGLASSVKRSSGQSSNPDYIIVGSGPGGGPLAANLAAAGYSVVLMEAGEDGGDIAQEAALPLFNPFVASDPRISWNYFVRHYADQAQQQLDSKYVPAPANGILYPRASVIGGCSVHNVLVMLYPNNSDFDNIAQLTGDDTWSSDSMRYYFQRLERCRYVVRPPDVYVDPTRHGYYGWQPTELSDPTIYTKDPQLNAIIKSAANSLGVPGTYDAFLNGTLDPNTWSAAVNETEGIYAFPLSRYNGARVGIRERVLAAVAQNPNLTVMTNTLATRVLFNGTTAIGVEYVQGGSLYRASPQAPAGALPQKQQLMANREVIVSCGTFNSPQLLMLSGIGPSAQLKAQGISTLVDLPGVGQNMQDRYEIAVVSQLAANLTVLAGCLPTQPGDPCLAEWLQGKGPYTGNESVFGAVLRSAPEKLVRDLILILAAGPFHGYYPGWQGPVTSTPNQFSWLGLKAHNVNRSGTVQLNSADPRDMPNINFHYFQEGNDTGGDDLKAVVRALQLVRALNAAVPPGIITQEVLPGPKYQTAADLATWVKNEAWGHHASCSNKMGPVNDPMSVVDSDFRVHGTKNLRVVDASIFPQIPGYYVMIPIMMVSEKASDVILSAASGG